MSAIGWADTGLLVVGTCAVAVFLWAYMASNPWWTGRAGRALVGQGAGIALILGYAALKRLCGWPSVPVVTLVIYALVVVMEVAVAVTFVRERRTWMSRARRAREAL